MRRRRNRKKIAAYVAITGKSTCLARLTRILTLSPRGGDFLLGFSLGGRASVSKTEGRRFEACNPSYV